MRFKVKAPASSANLGPGFDALALALDIWNEIEIDTEAEPGVELTGPDAAILAGRDNYSLLAMKELAQAHNMSLPAFGMVANVSIPVSRGLGSSAAALVCGLMAADHLLDLQLGRSQIFQRAWQMEGHGDNVGAAIYGGAILAVSGLTEPIELTPEDGLGLVAVAFIPEVTSATWAARAALPSSVPLPDAAFNVGTASSLAIGLMTRNFLAISAGMQDRLHQPYRSRLFPHLTPMTDSARSAGGLGACLSGAGPTILALVQPENTNSVSEAFRKTADEHRVKGSVVTLNPVFCGAELEEIDLV
jgi:homoserine kinase